jgi:hypothetical protein
LDGLETVGFAVPGHAIAFLTHVHGLSKHEFELVEVNLSALSANFREEAQEFSGLVRWEVVGGEVEFFGLVGHENSDNG